MASSFFRPCLRRISALLITSAVFALRVWAVGSTDTLTWGGDNSRTGYESNHNMDPKVVASAEFGQIFKTLLPGNFHGMAAEQIFSAPLLYTGSDGAQYVYVATTQNNIYKLDAKTGAIIASRNLHVPFLQVELGSCVDINPLIGVTATGVIDPDTGIWYVTAKTYAEQFQDGKFSTSNPPGRLNGRIYQHAIHTEDLSEVSGWPVSLEGRVFRNNPNRMFLSGNEHSRPGALLVGDYLYTGYASHCVQYNYTGAMIGFNKRTGAVVEMFATEGGPEPNTVAGGGVWMSGGGLAYDGKGSMYFSSGNGYASQLKPSGNSVPGRSMQLISPVNPSAQECHDVLQRLCGPFLQPQFPEQNDNVGATPGTAILDFPTQESPQTQINNVYAMMWPNANPGEVDVLMQDGVWTGFFPDIENPTQATQQTIDGPGDASEVQYPWG